MEAIQPFNPRSAHTIRPSLLRRCCASLRQKIRRLNFDRKPRAVLSGKLMTENLLVAMPELKFFLHDIAGEPRNFEMGERKQ